MSLNGISWTIGPDQNDFTELFLMMYSIKIAQMVPLQWTKGLPDILMRNVFKKNLLHYMNL